MGGRRATTRRGIALGCAVAALWSAGCACAPAPGGPSQQKGEAAEPVVLSPENYTRVVRDEIETGPRISGSLEAERLARVRAEVGGSVTEVRAEIGEPVKQGQVLAQVEEQTLRDALLSARSAVRSAQEELDLAQRDVQRTRRLVSGGAIAQHDLEQAQSARAAARARLDDARSRLASAEKDLDSATVRAPFDGLVSVRAVNVGDVVAPGTELFTIIDPSSMRLQASVPSEALPKLERGAPVDFEVVGYPDEVFRGHIEQIAPSADPATRQITLLASIPNPGGRLVAGLFAEGRVATQRRTTLVVPMNAVDRESAVPTVRRVRNGKVESVAVELGLEDLRTERVEITSGVREGDVLITSLASDVQPGAAVKLLPSTPSPTPTPAGAPER